MSIRVALLCTLAASVCPAYESLAHHLSVLEPTDKNVDKKKEEQAHKDLPMEDPISIMRGELCWARIELVGHVDCMKWLVDECTGKSFGTGLCRRVRAHVKEHCMAKDERACDYARLLGIDISDLDGDKVKEELDAFPADPKEWKDSDGDGFGDNEDDYPNDPECHTKKEPCIKPTPPPAPVAVSPASAPGPAPAIQEKASAPAAKEEAAAAPAPKKEEPSKAPAPAPAKAPAAASAPAQFQAPDAKDGLQAQGFSGKKVLHIDGETATGDWGSEYGHKKEPKKSGAQMWKVSPWMCAAVAALAVVSAA